MKTFGELADYDFFVIFKDNQEAPKMMLYQKKPFDYAPGCHAEGHNAAWVYKSTAVPNGFTWGQQFTFEDSERVWPIAM